MVKKEFCDRCGKEIQILEDDFMKSFNEISSNFDKIEGNHPAVLEPIYRL